MATLDFWKLQEEILEIPDDKIESFLESVPRARLLQPCSAFGLSLLHVVKSRRAACKLFSLGLDINRQSVTGNTPLHELTQIAMFGLDIDSCSDIANMIELFLAMGADAKLQDVYGSVPFLYCRSAVTAKIYISNGLRLDTSNMTQRLTKQLDELVVFQKGVIQCRNVIWILLGLKKHRKKLPRLDRFLVQQVIAVEIWSTRKEQVWQ